MTTSSILSPTPRIGDTASLQNKIARVTGGSSGLAWAIDYADAAAGAHIISTDVMLSPPKALTNADLHKDGDMRTPTVDVVNAKWPATATSQGMEWGELPCFDLPVEKGVRAAVAFEVQRSWRLDIMVEKSLYGPRPPFMLFFCSQRWC